MREPRDWEVKCPNPDCRKIIDCQGMALPRDRWRGEPVACRFCRSLMWVTRERWKAWNKSRT